MSPRTLQELLTTDKPAWPLVHSCIQAAKNQIEALPPDDAKKDQALLDTQVTLRSPLGAVVYNTGGILVDHGWLRFPGSGNPRFSRSLPEWNRGRTTNDRGKPRGFWLVADDVVGGFFALNGGAFHGEKGEIFYYAPDTLRWEPLNGLGYGEFLAWSFSPALAKFYESMRWTGWQSEVAGLSGDQAFSIYPFLWTKEGKDISKCSRKRCPVAEIFSVNVIEVPRQLEYGGET